MVYRNFQYVVSQGLKKGDRVIVEGYDNLMPGAELNISQWQTAEQPNQA